MGCNDVDASSSTSSIVPSSSVDNSSSYSDTSSLESSSYSSDELEPSSESESSSSEESSSESSIQVYYHVRFVNDDDSLLYEVDVLEGESAVYGGETPTKEGTDTISYQFKGWDKDYSSVTSDLTIVATYFLISEDTETGWSPIRW